MSHEVWMHARLEHMRLAKIYIFDVEMFAIARVLYGIYEISGSLKQVPCRLIRNLLQAAVQLQFTKGMAGQCLTSLQRPQETDL